MDKYFEDGYVVENITSLRAKISEINTLLGQLLELDPASTDFFNKVHLGLENKFANRENYFGFLKAFTNSPVVQSISADPGLLELVKSCGVETPSLVTPPILHIVAQDLIADASKVFTPPHQDVISTKGSIGQVVVWIPLHDVDEDNYGISAIPGSHRLGILETLDSGFGHTVEPSQISELSSEYISLKLGDAVVFSQYLVHHTHKVGQFRMALSFRFNDISDEDWANRHYFVSFERVAVKAEFSDNRDKAPSKTLSYFNGAKGN